MNLVDSVTALMSRDHVVIGVDFDGTLAPLVEHPADAVAEPEALEILARLARQPGVTVAIVSGRALADLKERLGEVTGALLVGEHGNDTGETVEMSQAIVDAKSLVGEILNTVGPLTVEEKPRSVTVHTRGVDPEVESEIVARVKAWVASNEEVRLLEGKKVLELTTADKTKGIAIAQIAEGADGVVFIGDDVTDETVFEVLGDDDIGVKVGAGPTSARFRVDDVSGVVDVLRVALISRQNAGGWHD